MAARTAPDLYQLIKAADNENTKGNELPNYVYPLNVVTSTMLNYLAKYGQDFRLRQEDVSDKIGELDAQKAEGKGLYGGGFLISEKAAAEKAAAEKAAARVWQLSERELEIIRTLG